MKTFMILALAAFVSTASAQPPMGEGYGAGKGRDLKTMLGLDDATAAKIDKLRDDHQKNVIALRAKMKSARVDFRSMMKKDNPDESALISKQKEISAMKGELEASMLKHRFAVAKLLTPEQQELMREHRGRGIGEGRGQGHRGHAMEGRNGRGGVKRHREHRAEGSCCR